MSLRARLPALLSRRVLPAVLGVNLLLLLFFLTFSYQILFHSDSAVKNLLAQEIYETGQYFPRDWNYVNNDLWVFYTQTFIIPFVGWFRNGFLLHAVSDLVSATLILVASWRITGMLDQSPVARLTSMIMISCGMSLIFAEHVFGQAAYGSMYYMGCFLVYSYWRLTQAAAHRAQLGWSAATVILALLVFWANPQRAIMYYGLPLGTAALVLYALDWARSSGSKQRRAHHHAVWMTVLALGAAAGIALHYYTLQQVNNTSGLTVIRWLKFEEVTINLLGLVRGLLAMFDGMPRPEVAVVSSYGAYSVLRLMAALAILVLLPWAALKSLQTAHRGRLMFAVFALVSLFGNLLLIVLTSLADMNSPEGSTRYLVPSLLYLLLLMPGVLVDCDWVKPSTRAIGVLTMVVLATSAPVVYIKSFDNFYRKPLLQTWMQNEHLRLGLFLQENHLYYGYSPFWNAGKTTVLMNQRVKMRQINFDQGLPVPMRFLSSNRWYRQNAWQGETFLAVQDNQIKDIDFDKLAPLVGRPVRTLRFESNWYIYVFAGNLAAIPLWDIEALTQRRYTVDAASAHQIGRLEAPAGQAAALVGAPEESGALLFGPQRGVATGAYVAQFDVEAIGAPQDFGHVDISINGGKQVLGQQSISKSGRQTITVHFRADHPLEPLELRVFKQAGGQLKVYSTAIQNSLQVSKERISNASIASQ